MTIIPQCFRCVHFDHQTAEKPDHVYRCDAFPTVIPREIIFNRVIHDKPYPGDNGIRFEREADDEPEGGEDDEP